MDCLLSFFYLFRYIIYLDLKNCGGLRKIKESFYGSESCLIIFGCCGKLDYILIMIFICIRKNHDLYEVGTS